MSAVETARAFADAAGTPAVLDLLDEDLEWTTPRGRTYDRATIGPELAEPEGYAELDVLREGHEYVEVSPTRALVLYDTIYRWKDEQGLANRVPSGAVFDVREGKIVRAQVFLDAEKARAAAEREAA